MPRPPTPLRRRLRLAQRLCDLYSERFRSEVAPYPSQAGWIRLIENSRKLQEVRRRGWSEKRGTLDLLRTAVACQRELDSFVERLESFMGRPPASTLRDLHQELAALEEEFEEVAIDPGSRTVSVVTERIDLEGVDLGAFRIVLVCEQVAEPDYRIEALEPREPASSDFGNVTHPHVRDEDLCEGEGQAAIRAAFASGRLFDFFALVRQVLRTYNPGSAYARLDEWYGTPCSDCGYRANEDETICCSRCSDPTCLHCSRSCFRCDADLCSGCSESCDACGERLCPDCLSSSGGLCTDCSDQQENDDEEIEDDERGAGPGESPTAADPPLQPVCLGEAGLPA